MPSTVLENIKRATQTTLDALNAWDYDKLVAIRTDDFIFQGLPSSLQLPAMTNEEYRGLWSNIMTPAFQDFKIEPLSRMHDGEGRKSTVFARVRAQTAVGPRTWELVMMMSFDEAGEKLTRLDEFFDSKVYLEMMEAMQKQSS